VCSAKKKWVFRPPALSLLWSAPCPTGDWPWLPCSAQARWLSLNSLFGAVGLLFQSARQTVVLLPHRCDSSPMPLAALSSYFHLPKHLHSRSCCFAPCWYFSTPISSLGSMSGSPFSKIVVELFLTAKPTFRGREGPLLVPPDFEFRLCPWSYLLQIFFLLCCVYSSHNFQFPYQKISPEPSFSAEFDVLAFLAHTSLTIVQKKKINHRISRSDMLLFPAPGPMFRTLLLRG